IRDVVYTEAGSTRRRLFHHQALEMLQQASAPAAELAHHALAAGLPEAALHWSIAAGDEAMRLFAVRDALVYYEQAQQLTRQAADAPLHIASASTAIAPFDLFHLSLQLGWTYELSSQFAQATSIYQQMLTSAQAMGESEMECKALNRLANLAARYDSD